MSLNNKVQDPKLKEYFEQGRKVYSFSKLSTFNSCEEEFRQSYILKRKGVQNIYSEIGSQLHQILEDVYRKELAVSDVKSKYQQGLEEVEMLGMKFPSESIGESWRKDVGHFIENFTPMDTKMILEKHLLYEINESIVIQGYVDAIIPSHVDENGQKYVNIVDWKTSSRFSGKKQIEAGRQLISYKLAIEANTDYKVDKVGWFMIKYANVCWKLKNGKLKKKMVNRGKMLKEMKSILEKELSSNCVDDFEVELLLDQAIANNSFDNLPQFIKDKYTIEDCFVEYDVTDELIEEFKQYVINTVNAIEGKSDNEEDWKPVEINQSTSFYCANLCGHKNTCVAYRRYVEENADGFKKKDEVAKSEYDDLF